jgi:hypothetical protein
MRVTRRRLLSVAAAVAATPAVLRLAGSQGIATKSWQAGQFIFPGLQWETATPGELGWSIAGLAEAHRFFASLWPASLVVIDRGRLVVAWGDTDVSSSAQFGKASLAPCMADQYAIDT